MKFKVLHEGHKPKPRFYIHSIEDNAILYECPSEQVANQVCALWNRIGVSYRPDSTLDLDSLDTPLPPQV